MPLMRDRATRTPTCSAARTNRRSRSYDRSGLYTDPDARIDLSDLGDTSGAQWIAERGDTEKLGAASPPSLRAREADPEAGDGVSHQPQLPRRREARRPTSPDALRKRGIVTPEDGVRRIRENQRPAVWSAVREALLLAQHRAGFRREHPEDHHARIRARRDRARPRDPSQQHQPPESEPMIIGRNFLVKINANIGNSRGVLGIGEEGREDGLGDPLGRRHGDGPVTGRTSTRPASGSSATRAGADRHRADLPGAGKVDGRAEELTWEIFRDTLIEQAEQGVDYFTIHAGVLLRTSCR